MEGPVAVKKVPDRTALLPELPCPPHASAFRSSAASQFFASTRRLDVTLVMLLIVLAGGIRAWLITHTEVAARDSIGFIRYAAELEQMPWTKVLSHSHQHPGYPILIMAVSWPIRQFAGGTTPQIMQLSAQIAGGLAGILLTIPMYFLGKELLDRKTGFWGAALFQCLPVSARVLSDGLSESTFLLFTCSSLLFAAQAARSGSYQRFALCGFLAGLAYLVRPEGGLIVVAVLVALIGLQFSKEWRRPWTKAVGLGTCMAVAAAMTGSPFVWATGSITVKPTPRIMIGSSPLEAPRDIDPSAQRLPGSEKDGDVADAPRPLFASLFAIYASPKLKDHRLWAFQAIGTEVAKGYQYFALVPVVVGVWIFRGRIRSVPGAWVIAALCGLHFVVLWRLAVVMGYLSDRHVLLLVLCGAFPAAGAVAFLGQYLTGLLLKTDNSSGRFSWLTLSLLLLLTCFGLPQTFRSLHSNRAGHHAAGLWLAANANSADEVSDPFCWANYYAGRIFMENGKTEPATGYRPVNYFVVEHADHEHYRLNVFREDEIVAAGGKVVYHWPENRSEADGKVFVYALSK